MSEFLYARFLSGFDRDGRKRCSCGQLHELGTREILPIECVKRTMDLHIPQTRKHIIEPNKRALQCGIDYVRGRSLPGT